LTIEFATGNPAVDRYLMEGYEQVRGMSSRFAAAICGHLIRRQSELGVGGDLVEIGTFEGRFFIAMALGLAPGEFALGVDTFAWPDPGIEARFLAHCATHGLAPDRFTAWKTDSRTITLDTLRGKLSRRPVRFIHLDSEHKHEHLTHELELAHAVLHRDGLICLDDMLHPGYSTLIKPVLDYLAKHPEMRVVCIIDREDIVAAPKFLICRRESVALYEQDLMQTFARYHYVLGADMLDYVARPLIKLRA
jgi:Methyltransferase domain